MGSTEETDKKRRHFSSTLPTAGPAAEKHLLALCADDKKLDVAVLQYQNQKLFQQLEAQKAEYLLFEDKYNNLKKQQEIYEDTVAVVHNSWEQLVTDLESCSIGTRKFVNTRHDFQGSQILNDRAFIPIQDDFLSRLLESGATESCSYSESAAQRDYDIQLTSETTKKILQNIISSINWMWHGIDNFTSSVRAIFSEDGMRLQKSVDDLRMEVRSVIVEVNDLHLKHRLLGSNIQILRDMDAELKAQKKHLAGELASTMSELEESKSKLASLKAQSDGSNAAPILFSKLGSKQSSVEMASNGQKETKDMEASLKVFKDLAASSIVEISNLHERRIEIFKKLVNVKNVLAYGKSISSSRAFLMLKDQLDKSKMEMDHYRVFLKKLQVETDNFLQHEKEVNSKFNIAEISGKICEFLKSRIAELEQELLKFIQDRILMELRLQGTSREPGREEIIANFKELVSSLPKEIEAMQRELGKLKDSSSVIHSLRAQVQSLSALLQREADKLQSLFDKSAGQLLEIKNLYLVIGDLRESEQDLKLILEMYRRESIDSWDVMESRDMEFKALAHVQSLKSSLDEHNLESLVKAAIEAEAVAQQRLATAEDEIADLKLKLKLSVRQIVKSSEELKSKNEECETYFSEIESIGQAYENMPTRNKRLLQEIIDRDDCNIKVAMEVVKARQLHDVVFREIKNMDGKLQEADSLLHLYDLKVLTFDEELKHCSEKVEKLAEGRRQNFAALGNAQRRLSDVYTESKELRQSLTEMQIQAEKSTLEVTEFLIELERERFNKKRVDEGLEAMTIKATSLKTQTDGLVLMEELRQEISEYREILKCCICHERQKDVVIAKCYHLFCRQCVQSAAGTARRRRKCPTCSATFGPNDIKPIYI